MAHSNNAWLEQYELKAPDYDYIDRDYVGMEDASFPPARYTKKGDFWVPKKLKNRLFGKKRAKDEDDDDEWDEDDEEGFDFGDEDSIIYEVVCGVCGEVINFDEETLEEGSMTCPKCGELLEFSVEEDEEEEEDEE